MPTAIALRHVHFEDVGAFARPLAEAGFTLRYHDAGLDETALPDPLADDLAIVLGGPVGAYETDLHPFLADETAWLRTRLAADRPTLGICLGAQLVATALGAAVRPTGTKEIGFAPVSLEADASDGPLRHLDGMPVLHWHGDMFEIPDGAVHLASTVACRNQAFARGPNVLGLQFHAEVDATVGFERWLIGHAGELAGAGIDPRTLREAARRHGAVLRDAGRTAFADWLSRFGKEWQSNVERPRRSSVPRQASLDNASAMLSSDLPSASIPIANSAIAPISISPAASR